MSEHRTIGDIHPVINDLLKDTFGCIIYQEQVMMIVRKVFKMSLGEADMVRRAIGKKDPELMKEMINKMSTHDRLEGISDEDVKEILNTIEVCSGYLFNKSHSAAYAYTAYQTAYLKEHYPVAFYCALFNSNIDQDKAIEYMEEAKRVGIEIYYPDIVLSDFKWKPEGKGIRMGFTMISGVGGVEFKKPSDRDLQGFYEFIKLNPKLNKRVSANLVKAGCFPDVDRLWALDYIEWDKMANNRKTFANERLNKFRDNPKKVAEWEGKIEAIDPPPAYVEKTTSHEKLNMQVEVLKMSNVNLLGDYNDAICRHDGRNKLCQIINLKRYKSKKGNYVLDILAYTGLKQARFILTTKNTNTKAGWDDYKEGDVVIVRTKTPTVENDGSVTYFSSQISRARLKVNSM